MILLDDVGFGASSAFGGPCDTPTFERLAAGGLKYTRFHTTALCSPTRAGAAHRPQPPLGRHGRHHRDRHVRARLQLGAPEHQGAAGGDAQAERLLDGAVRQVPRGAGVGDAARWGRSTAGRPVAAGSSTSTGSSAARTTSGTPRCTKGTTPIEPPKTPEEGYHLTEDLTDQADQLGAPAEGADARQAVLHVLRAGRHPRAAPRAEGVDRQVQGQVRPRLGPSSARSPSRSRRSSASSPPMPS